MGGRHQRVIFSVIYQGVVLTAWAFTILGCGQNEIFGFGSGVDASNCIPYNAGTLFLLEAAAIRCCPASKNETLVFP